MVGYKQPPAFSGNFETWEVEVKLWAVACGVDTNKQGAALALSLPVNSTARQLALNVGQEELVKETGVEEIIKVLKPIYQADSVDQRFRSLMQIQRLTRLENEDINHFISKFEDAMRYHVTISGTEPYADDMKSFILIDKANLGETNEKIVRSSVTEWKYEQAVTALKRVFGGSASNIEMKDKFEYHEPDRVRVKEEQITLYNNQRYPKKKAQTDDDAAEKDRKKKEWLKHVKCYKCNEYGHLKRDCPLWRPKPTYHVPLDMNGPTNSYAQNQGVIDTGASKSVAGYNWLKCYEDDSEQRLKRYRAEMSFRFGDQTVFCTEKVELPIKMNDEQADLKLEIYLVETDIPLLISLETMKECEMSIDFKRDLLKIGDQSKQLILTEKGHYVLPLLDIHFNKSGKQKPTGMRIHRVFGHASAAKIIETLKSTNDYSEELGAALKKIDESCDFCLKQKRHVSIPKTAAVYTQDFNELVCVDLKEINGIITLQIIDSLTRFALGGVVKNKSGPVVTNCFIVTWIGIFGPPLKLLSDVGGEFVGMEEFNAMCELFNIDHRTTAGFSPFSNGTVERHNGLVESMVLALMEDMNIKIDVALPWALQAKNNLMCLQGFTPSQLVFGKNLRVPSVSNVKEVSELREETKSKYLADKINCMAMAREQFLKAERSMKLKRALKSKVENSRCEHYVNGDKVYFKRNLIDKDWHGPGRVVGQLAGVVIVLFGGNLIRIHHTKIKMRTEAIDEMNKRENDSREVPAAVNKEIPLAEKEVEQEPDRIQTRNQKKVLRIVQNPTLVETDESEDEISETQERTLTDRTGEEQLMNLQNEEPLHEESEDNRRDKDVDDHAEGEAVVESSDRLTCDLTEAAETELLDGEPRDETTESEDINSERWADLLKGKTGRYDLKSGDKIRFKTEKGQSFEEVLVVDRSGKATSDKLKNRFNVMPTEGEPDDMFRVTLDKVHDVQIAETLYVLMSCEDNLLYNCSTEERIKDDDDIRKAKMAEVENIKKFKVFEEVREHGQNVISSRWVLTSKTVKSKLVHKARLVARGFEETTGIQSDSPTVEKASIRLFFAISLAYEWSFQSLDIKAAFLQSTSLDRVIYIKPPKDIRKPGILWKLLKPLYGINDAGRQWYFTLTQFLVHDMKCSQGLLDKAVYRSYDARGKLSGIILIHVDDVLYAGTLTFRNTVIKGLINHFEISKSFDGAFTYIGWNLTQKKDVTIIDQIAYGKSMKTVEMTNARRKEKDELLNQTEIKQYQCLIGQLNWMGCQTRPDLKFDILELSTKMKTPNIEDLIKANKVVQKMQERTVKLVYHKLDINNIKILLFADASLGNLPNEGSARGHLVMLWCSRTRKVNVISWQSNKVKRVCHATLDSETLSMIEGLEDAIYVRAVLSELIHNDNRSEVIPIYAYTDNKQLYDNVHSSHPCKNRRLRIDIAEIEEMLRLGNITKLSHIVGEQMIADVLTKKHGQVDLLLTVLESGNINQEYLQL